MFFLEWMDFGEANVKDNVWPWLSAYTTDEMRELFKLARRISRQEEFSIMFSIQNLDAVLLV